MAQRETKASGSGKGAWVAPPEIAQLGHVSLTTIDISKSLWFWTEVIGLHEVERKADSIYLRGWGEHEHHSLVLTAHREALVDHVGWRTKRAEDVEAFARILEGQGVAIERVQPGEELGQGESVRFTSPMGQVFELFYEIEKVPAPESQRSRLKNSPYRLGASIGAAPRRIDHVNMHAPAVEDATRWLTETFGFKTREYTVDENDKLTSAWMSVTPLVHDIAVAQSASGVAGEFNHLAYWVDNWQDVFSAADVMMEHGIQTMGPGRHGISQATFMYVIDPGSGHMVEIFSGSYLILAPDWEPIKWRPQDMDAGIVWWGPKRTPIPRGYHTRSAVLAHPATKVEG